MIALMIMARIQAITEIEQLDDYCQFDVDVTVERGVDGKGKGSKLISEFEQEVAASMLRTDERGKRLDMQQDNPIEDDVHLKQLCALERKLVEEKRQELSASVTSKGRPNAT